MDMGSFIMTGAEVVQVVDIVCRTIGFLAVLGICYLAGKGFVYLVEKGLV
jgi:hypothetical protein